MNPLKQRANTNNKVITYNFSEARSFFIRLRKGERAKVGDELGPSLYFYTCEFASMRGCFSAGFIHIYVFECGECAPEFNFQRQRLPCVRRNLRCADNVFKFALSILFGESSNIEWHWFERFPQNKHPFSDRTQNALTQKCLSAA